MRYKLAQFFAGRNGVDSLSTFLSWVGLALLLISSLLSGLAGGILSTLLWAVAVLCIVISLLRMLSRRTDRRAEENARFQRLIQPLKFRFRAGKTRFDQRKDYKFFKCPGCKNMLRVPRGKGQIQVTCRKCGTRFSAKT